MGLADIGSPTEPRNQPSHTAHHQSIVDAIGTNVDQVWHIPQLLNGWAQYPSTSPWWTNDIPRYRMLPGRLVVIEGFTKFTGTLPPTSLSNLEIFRLPDGYVPDHSMHFWAPTAGWQGTTGGTIVNVFGNDYTGGDYNKGSVVAQYATGVQTSVWLSLSGISFVVEGPNE